MNQIMIGKNMIGFVAKSIGLLSTLCAFSFGAWGGTMSIEQDFPNNNCGITFPAGWHVQSNFPSRPGVVAAYIDTTRNRAIILVIDNIRPSGPIDDRFIAGYDQHLEKIDGDKHWGGNYIEVGGIKSYERFGAIDSHGQHISTVNLLVPGENAYYDVLAMRYNGDASDDPEIQQIIGSFRFLHPFVPAYDPNSIAFRIGRLIGHLIVILFVVAIVVLAVRS